MALALALTACGSSSSSSSNGGINVGNETVPPAAASIVTASSTTSSASQYPAGCTPAQTPAPRVGESHLSAPTTRLNPKLHYTVKMITNCGEIDIALAVREAPKTSASFASLVQRGFYDDLTFHRIVPGFVIQGGDPLGTGLGGPGYTTVEAPPAGFKYQIGSVAMAKTSTEPNGSAGSQFFIIVGAQGAALPPQYAIAGHVSGGLKAVNAIAQVPTSPSTQMPLVPVVISSATLSAS